jgi:hypothetical protein
MVRSTNDTLRLCRELGQGLLDPESADAAVRAESVARVPAPVLCAAGEETQSLLRPRHDEAIAFFGTRYRPMRPCAPTFLQPLTFQAQGPDDTVLRAVEGMRTRARAPTRRPGPRDAPMALVTDPWRPDLRAPDGSMSRRDYARCTLWPLRSALRAGHVWVAHRRRYADPDTSLNPPAEWSRWRPEGIRHTGPPSDGAIRRAARAAELERPLAAVERLLARKGSHVRVDKDDIGRAPLEADPRPARAEALADRLTARLPCVERSALLMAGDTWTHWSRPFCPAADAEPPRPPLFPQLYASLVAHACKFGVAHMAHLSDLAYDALAWCPTGLLREDTRKAAGTRLVHSHHQRP